ncbi:MAG TPA: SGNH/GDSL hydrolase family protein [Armatimonadota bacterium]|jgi:lysophospholipase L1-like esterase
MSARLCFLALLAALATASAAPLRADPAPVRVLLLGDSTVQGSAPRAVAPEADSLETVIQKLLAADPALPPVEVLNKGQNGDTVRGLLTNRYAREVLGLPGAKPDYILIRYGINDYSHYPHFVTEFPAAYHELIARLRQDYPQALVTVETIFPFYDEATNERINDLIRQVAAEEKLPLLDTNARCVEETKLLGPHSLTQRYLTSLDPIPEKLRALIPKNCIIYGTNICVEDNSLDVHFREVPGWFGDGHPNLAGYHVIGDEIAKYLAPLIAKRDAPGE